MYMVKLSVDLFHQIWYNFSGKISVWIAEILSASGGFAPKPQPRALPLDPTGARPPVLQYKFALRTHRECYAPHFSNWGYTADLFSVSLAS
jgi:hypothetical protein